MTSTRRSSRRWLTTAFVASAVGALCYSPGLTHSSATAQDGAAESEWLTRERDQKANLQQFQDLMVRMRTFADRLRESGFEEKADLVDAAIGHADEKQIASAMEAVRDLFHERKPESGGRRSAGCLRGQRAVRTV